MATKILITGSNGLLGQYLLKILCNNPAYIVYGSGLGHNRCTALNNQNYVTLNITNGDAVFNTIATIQPHVIIHTAASTNVDACEAEPIMANNLNVLPLRFLTMACEQYSCKLIHLSTDFIFDGLISPLNENAIPNPLSVYGSTKLQAEKVVIATKINYAILRTSLVYGVVQDMSRSNIILWVKNQLTNNNPIKVVNDQIRCPTYAYDLAMACKLIIDKNATGIFNICGKDALTPYQMALHTAQYYKLNKSLITAVDGTVFTQPAARPKNTHMLITKAQTILGYAPYSFAAGIAAMHCDAK